MARIERRDSKNAQFNDIEVGEKGGGQNPACCIKSFSSARTFQTPSLVPRLIMIVLKRDLIIVLLVVSEVISLVKFGFDCRVLAFFER